MVALRPFRDMAGRFGLSKSALFRHHDEHLPAAVLASSRAAEVTRGDDLVDRIIVLARETQAVLDRAKAAEDGELAARGLARAERQRELQAKLPGQIKEGGPGNITLAGGGG